ncbi:hypothetical protein G6F22_022091 [Rhizopus arrhizus]|nr:hypothetical protein G6F22_022091 [Rhizopus arrhizus]
MLAGAQHVRGVLGRGDGAAMAKHDDIRAHRQRGGGNAVDGGHAPVQRLRGLGADGAARRQAHVRDDDT